MDQKITKDQAQHVKTKSHRGLQYVLEYLEMLAAADAPDLPPDLALRIRLLPCYADPNRRQREIRAIVRANLEKIEAYNASLKVASQGRVRTVDERYAEKAAEQDAVEALRRKSSVFAGPKGERLAREVLANRKVMLMLDMEYIHIAKHVFRRILRGGALRW